MALATYGDLKTSVAAWLGRADLTTTIPDFVTLCHKQLMRDLRGHVRLQKRDTAFTISSEYMAAPTDFLEFVSGYLNTTPKVSLQFWPSDTMTDYFGNGTGKPLYIAVVGSTTNVENFRFGPAPDGTYTATIEYYATLTFFSGDGVTNWILTDHPDLYLYGSLLQATAYLSDDPRLPVWQQAYQAALQSCRAEGRRARWGANGMSVKAA